MTLKQLFSTTFLCFFISTAFTQILYVNNTGNGVEADYTTLQEAVDGATDGAILYLYPSGVSYGDATIRHKRLAIIGGGFKVAANVDPNANTNPGSSIVGAVDFKTGSSNSMISGCESTADIDVDSVSGIKIIGNYLIEGVHLYNCTDITFSKNYSVDSRDAIILSNATGIIISNNVFLGRNNYSYCGGCTDYDYPNLSMNSVSSGTILNNIFNDDIKTYNSSVKNNVFLNAYNGGPNPNGNQVNGSYNNVSNNAFVRSGYHIDGNLTGVDVNSIFVGYSAQGPYSFDQRFQLKENSPALGYGIDGVDCGIFGGNTPYVPSGVPDIPVVYEISAPNSASTGGGLNVTVKARSGQ